MLKDILETIGVKPMINASATETVLGGSRMHPEVVKAMAEASRNFFDIRELHAAVGKRIAELTKNKAAMVSGGVASSFYLISMALIKLTDPDVFEKIPAQPPKGQSAIVYKSHRVEYVCGIEQAGLELRVIGDVGSNTDPEAELLEKEILREKPLFFLYVMAGLWIPPGAPTLESAIRVCKKHRVPLILDAAAQLPPRSNFWNFTKAGADIVLFSGGKDLQGPSHTGLVLGDERIVEACREIISPNEGVGRFFKIGKEELIAALTAVEMYMKKDEDTRLAWCEAQVDKLIRGLGDLPGITAERSFPNEAGQPVPRVKIGYDQDLYRVSPQDLIRDFKARPVRIAFMPDPGKGFYCNPMTLGEGESEIIISEIKDYFSTIRGIL